MAKITSLAVIEQKLTSPLRDNTGESILGFFGRTNRDIASGIVPKMVILGVVSFSLNACVSQQAPNTMQVDQQLSLAEQNADPTDQSIRVVKTTDTDKQLSVPGDAVVSVPQSNPKKSDNSELALISQSTDANSTKIEELGKNPVEGVAQDNKVVSATQPEIAKPGKKPNLLALLFQRNPKRNTVVSPKDKTAVIDNTNQSTTPVDGVVVPSLRPVQAGEAVKDSNQNIDNQSSNSQNSNDTQTITNAPTQDTIANKQKKARRKPGFFASLLQRNKKNTRIAPKATDDRHNSILLSSRTASRANQITAIPINAGMANISKAINKQNGKNIQLASAAGLSRNAVNGIVTQHSGVDVDCITSGVVRILQYVEQKYGSKPVVTSGYRSPSRNRRAGGARNSMHIYCRAVDIQVKGVSKWHLAKFLRTVPGRGGVGTYCRTNSVHIDTGPKRDWHYSCRRKTKRRRKS